MPLGPATERTLITLTNGSSSAADAGDLDSLRLSLGLARRTAQILDVLTDVDRPDWRAVHAAAGVCVDLIDALALMTGAFLRRAANITSHIVNPSLPDIRRLTATKRV